jgi:hypothetical protein
MLTRTLATFTLLLALNGGTDATPAADTHLNGARAPHRARLVDVDDDVGGCRETPPVQVAVAPASCADEGQP